MRRLKAVGPGKRKIAASRGGGRLSAAGREGPALALPEEITNEALQAELPGVYGAAEIAALVYLRDDSKWLRVRYSLHSAPWACETALCKTLN